MPIPDISEIESPVSDQRHPSRRNATANANLRPEAELMATKKSCWSGYEKRGTKKKGGKTVNNCVLRALKERRNSFVS